MQAVEVPTCPEDRALQVALKDGMGACGHRDLRLVSCEVETDARKVLLLDIQHSYLFWDTSVGFSAK